MAQRWHPGMNVLDETVLGEVIDVVGFGKPDQDLYTAIKLRFAAANITVVQDLDRWTRLELASMIRTLKPKKHPNVYLAEIEAAIKRTIRNGNGASKVKVEGQQNGDKVLKHTKVEPTAGFQPNKYEPDGRIYADLPMKGTQEYLTTNQEELYLDLLCLDLHANPEASIGDYLPSGMAKRLGNIHNARFPAFLPKHAEDQYLRTSRPAEKVITVRVQNQRFLTYKRMVLDEQFKCYIQPKAQAHINFVPSDSDELIDNVRNEKMAELVAVYHHGAEKAALPLAVSLNGQHDEPATPKGAPPKEPEASNESDGDSGGDSGDSGDKSTPATAAADSSDEDDDILGLLDGKRLEGGTHLHVSRY